MGKTAVVGAKDRATKRVSAKVVDGTDAETPQGFVPGQARPGASVHTDDHGAYRGMGGFRHEAVKHSVSGRSSYCAHVVPSAFMDPLPRGVGRANLFSTIILCWHVSRVKNERVLAGQPDFSQFSLCLESWREI